MSWIAKRIQAAFMGMFYSPNTAFLFFTLSLSLYLAFPHINFWQKSIEVMFLSVTHKGTCYVDLVLSGDINFDHLMKLVMPGFSTLDLLFFHFTINKYFVGKYFETV